MRNNSPMIYLYAILNNKYKKNLAKNWKKLDNFIA